MSEEQTVLEVPTERLAWVVSSRMREPCIVGTAHVPETMSIATAEASRCLIDVYQYGIPAYVPPHLVYRFSRCKAQPRKHGGGSLALCAALDIFDQHGLWAVLEASPYSGQDLDEL